MSFLFELKPQEALQEGFSRVLSEQVGAIKTDLSHHNSLVESIHSSRKHFKNIRSTLRLLRFQYGPDEFEIRNQFNRNLAARLSDIRDIHVLKDSVELLKYDSTTRLTSFNTEEMSMAIQTEIEEAESELIEAGVFADLLQQLTENPGYYDAPVLENDLTELINGLEHIYEAGYNKMYQAYLHPSIENFHEWRKSVKHLLHACQLLQNYWPLTASPTISNLSELSSVLGQEHDLGNLQIYITELADKYSINSELVSLFLVESEKKRTKLQRTAEYLGKEVFTETADYFIQHFQNKWQQHKLGV